MSRTSGIAAIIPAFNEERTVSHVVNVLLSCSGIAEVIVVDDGSEDGTADAARNAGARVISFSENKGKGEALRCGVEASSAYFLLFVDADLHTLRPEHVGTLIGMVERGEADMAIGVVDRKSALINNLNQSMLAPFSGFRLLRRSIWEAMEEGAGEGYLVDSALNVAAKRMGAPVAAVPFSGLRHVPKFSKRGLWRGTAAWLDMWRDILQRSPRLLPGKRQGKK